MKTPQNHGLLFVGGRFAEEDAVFSLRRLGLSEREAEEESGLFSPEKPELYGEK